jgi:hypothetical protein
MKQIVFLILLFQLAGCSTPQHSWPESSRDVVWTAMIAAANSPEYDDEDPRKRWVVVENFVDADASLGKILVRRKLSQSYTLPLQDPQIDERDWLFSIHLLPDQIPTATFESARQIWVWARLQDESKRYFDVVDMLLEKPTD